MGGDHKCPICPATFTRPQHVARHIRSRKSLPLHDHTPLPPRGGEGSQNRMGIVVLLDQFQPRHPRLFTPSIRCSIAPLTNFL